MVREGEEVYMWLERKLWWISVMSRAFDGGVDDIFSAGSMQVRRIAWNELLNQM